MPNANDARTPTLRATRTRHWILGFATTLAIITYIDRVCISQAAGDIQRDLGLTKVQMGWAFAAFAWAYALFEIPGGWLGDKIGPRKVLMRVVVWWSFFTAATGWAWNVGSLLMTRFLFGAGEAGCFPNLAKMFTNWLPQKERSRAVGVMWLSARWGGAFTPMLVVWVFSLMSWRRAFEVFGAIGIVWAIFFYRWFRDNPRDHKSVNAAELALLHETQVNSAGHANVPWAKMLRSRTVWMLWLQYFCFSWGWYFYITWLPTYLKEARGLDLAKSAVLAGFPLFFGGLGSLIGGVVANRLADLIGDMGRARRVTALAPYSTVVLIDKDVVPKIQQTAPQMTYEPGEVSGRAYVLSLADGKFVCAATISARNTPSADAPKFLDGVRRAPDARERLHRELEVGIRRSLSANLKAIEP